MYANKRNRDPLETPDLLDNSRHNMSTTVVIFFVVFIVALAVGAGVAVLITALATGGNRSLPGEDYGVPPNPGSVPGAGGSGGSPPGGTDCPEGVRLNPDQLDRFQRGYKQLVDSMGPGGFDPALLREPRYYTQDLIGGFTPEQEWQLRKSCGNPDIFRPRAERLNLGEEGRGQLTDRYPGNVTSDGQGPFRKKRNSPYSRACSATAFHDTNLVAVDGTSAQIVHFNNAIQWTFNEECTTPFDGHGQACCKIGRDASAFVYVAGTDVAQWKTVTIYSCITTD